MPREPLILPVAPWLPDLPAYNPKGSPNIRGVLPDTEASYLACPGLQPASTALTTRCQGAASFFATDGTVTQFAGDSQDLWQINVAAPATWANVSKSSHAYSIAATDRWIFDTMNNVVFATDYADPIQAFTLGSSSAYADLAAAAPKCKFLCIIKNAFVLACFTNDGTNGVKPQRAWWSKFGDATSWPTPGTAAAIIAQSSFNDLLGPGGPIQGCVSNLANADGLVFQRRAIYRVLYTNAPDFLSFPPCEGQRGCIAPGSIAQIGYQVVFLADDGLYLHDGVTATPIGIEQVDRFLLGSVANPGDMALLHADRVIATVDPANKYFLMAYPSNLSPDGTPDRILVWNWAIRRYSILEVNLETLTRMVTVGYTLDQLTTILGFTVDNTMPNTFDSPFWQGGYLIASAFNPSHQLGFFTGPNLAATIDTMDIQPFAGRDLNVTNARPLVDGTGGSIALGRRRRLADTPVFGSPALMNSLGTCGVRGAARYIRGRFTMPAGAAWSQFQGIELDGGPMGSRFGR